MKKLIISTSLFVAALVGANVANAQTKDCANNNCPQTEQCTPAQNCGKVCDTPCTKPCDNSSQCRFEGRDCAPRCNAFEGLNLTDKQRSQLEALGKEYKARHDGNKQKRGDFRKERLAKIKTILTPEQYTQFLENSFLQGGDRGSRFSGKMRHYKSYKYDRQRPARADKESLVR